MKIQTSIITGLMLIVAQMLATPFARGADPIDFEPVAEFLRLPADLTLGACSATAVDSQGRVYLFHRGKQPILCFNKDGSFLRSWGDNLIGKAHGLRVDRDDNVWVTDIGHHMVFKFSPTGKLLLALGTTDKPGLGDNQFNKPTDLAFGPQGEIYVSDGYGNNRVMKFDARGKFLNSWGTPGKGPGEFNVPHAILVDQNGRVVVGDRENNRVQVFNSDGKLLEIWTGFAPFGLTFDGDGRLFVADGRANKVLLLNSAGQVVKSWGKKGTEPGQFDLPHMLTADANGNLYVTEILSKRLQKLRRK